eukprot:COSAG01_NODE_1312_length_10767_cov_25.248969_6_plen_39_part_00
MAMVTVVARPDRPTKPNVQLTTAEQLGGPRILYVKNEL